MIHYNIQNTSKCKKTRFSTKTEAEKSSPSKRCGDTGSNLGRIELGRTETSQTKRTRSVLNRPGEELSKPLVYNWERDIEFAEVAGRFTEGDKIMDSDEYTTNDGTDLRVILEEVRK
jgi:hypothetical protein